jgi:hypothetical protein
VRAGLELIQAVGGLKSGVPLQTRVGVATGLVESAIWSGRARRRNGVSSARPRTLRHVCKGLLSRTAS